MSIDAQRICKIGPMLAEENSHRRWGNNWGTVTLRGEDQSLSCYSRSLAGGSLLVPGSPISRNAASFLAGEFSF
jgi:hypothetical protein